MGTGPGVLERPPPRPAASFCVTVSGEGPLPEKNSSQEFPVVSLRQPPRNQTILNGSHLKNAQRKLQNLKGPQQHGIKNSRMLMCSSKKQKEKPCCMYLNKKMKGILFCFLLESKFSEMGWNPLSWGPVCCHCTE